MEYAIQASGIVRAFPVADGKEFYALKGIDMDIPRGRLTILKGRSGSGKTTLLNILSALDLPSEGEVLFGEREISSLSERDRELLRRYEIGFVFQSVALIPIMNAYENVDYGLRLADYQEERDSRIKQVLNMVGLGGRLYHMPMQMSGGEQQRVAIARAVAHKPGILFADEPTGALDTASGLAVMKLFKELVEQEGITIVMTTHDPGLMELGDVVYELEDGEIIGREEHRGTGSI
ncbi:MAG: ABC transporter ATP-binding protein [Bacteroidales bacterium]|nr:ABC transporter ATP-binding protein [Clostridium sp.]MCM1203603.1 ABC transporter ATP-binding protein [Bacteroidales bacterium]